MRMLSVNELLFRLPGLIGDNHLHSYGNPRTSRHPGLAVFNTYEQVQQSHIELHDGSRTVGTCLKSDFKSHSATALAMTDREKRKSLLVPLVS
jgi:hypothetical protein